MFLVLPRTVEERAHGTERLSAAFATERAKVVLEHEVVTNPARISEVPRRHRAAGLRRPNPHATRKDLLRGSPLHVVNRAGELDPQVAGACRRLKVGAVE